MSARRMHCASRISSSDRERCQARTRLINSRLAGPHRDVARPRGLQVCRATRGKRKKASIDQETRQDADRPVNADQGSVNSVQAEAEPDLGSEDEGEDGEEYENEGGYYGNGMYDQQAEPINPWMANFQPNSASPDDPPATISEEEYNILVDLPMPSEEAQQTLRHTITLEGPGLHSGKIGRVRVMPAFAGEGRYFVMVQQGSIKDPEPPEALREQADQGKEEGTEEDSLKDKRKPFWAADNEQETEFKQEPDEIVGRSSDDIVIEATSSNARIFPEDALFVTLQHKGYKIYAAESLLASLEGSGVDNCRIEVEMRTDSYLAEEDEEEEEETTGTESPAEPSIDYGGQEIPFTDGSSLFWAEMIKEVKLRPAPVPEGEEEAPPKHFYEPNKVISVRDGDAFITLMPSSSQRITIGIDHAEEAPVIGCQWASWSPANSAQHHFRWSLAPARMYLPSAQEGLRRRAQGYFKVALDPNVTAIADSNSWHELENMRFEDEAVRWRLTEFLADLALLSSQSHSGIPRGHILAYQASRALTFRFMRALQKVCSAQTSQEQ